MSGIYIPGVSVPADDTVLLRVYPEENGYHFVERIDGIDQDFLGSYWAVPVPPHGDLIDRDAAAEKIWDDMRFPSNLANAQFFINELREMPTIIPAEGDNDAVHWD